MSDPTTPAKGLIQPSVDDDNDTWGDLINSDLALIDTALGGTLALSISGNTTLTTTQAENTGYEFFGTLSGAATITWPSFSGIAVIQNGTTGGFSIICKISGGASVIVLSGEIITIWSDGTKFLSPSVGAGNGTTGSGAVVQAVGPTISSPTLTSPIVNGSPIFSSPLSVANGGTGLDTYGALDGTSSAKTTTYTVANSDKRSTISLGGNTGYTVTVPAPSGFDADFQVRLYNADTSRAKTLAINGYSSFFLWPNQNVVVQNIGGAWRLYPNKQRWMPPQGTTFYVDPAGSDTLNDGLTPGSAHLTILHAWNTIRDQTDYLSPNIQLTPGAIYGALAGSGAISGELDGDAASGFGRLIRIVGDSTLVNPPIIQIPTNDVGILLRDGAWAQIDGIRFTPLGDNCLGIQIQQKALGDITNCIWDSFPIGFCVSVTDGGDCNFSLVQKFGEAGSAQGFFFVTFGGKLLCGAQFDGGGFAYSFGSFIEMDQLTRTQMGGTTFTGTGSFSGPKYALSHGSFLALQGVTIPGSSGSADAMSLAY